PNLQKFDFSSKAIEAVDESTVRVRLKGPSPGFVAGLTSSTNSPISPTAYDKLGKDGFAKAPVGAGPFKLVEWKSGDRITLERFPDYYRMGADGQGARRRAPHARPLDLPEELLGLRRGGAVLRVRQGQG